MSLWAVIPTRDRPALLGGLLEDLRRDGIPAVVVDTGDNPWVESQAVRVEIDRDPPNISRWWNAGLDEVESRMAGEDEWAVAVLNDDVRLPPGALDRLATVLRATKATVAFPDVHGLLDRGGIEVRLTAEPHNLFHRMTGWCWVVAGETRLRADEDLAWWYGDDDLEWRASLLGGVARVGGIRGIEHLRPNESTDEEPGLGEQAGRDRETFARKWGRVPW